MLPLLAKKFWGNLLNSVPFLPRFELTECSTVSRGIQRTERASSGNPNFISGIGMGRMWKSINIKRWSAEHKYISRWRKLWILSQAIHLFSQQAVRGKAEQTAHQHGNFPPSVCCSESHSAASCLIWFHFFRIITCERNFCSCEPQLPRS